MLQLMGNPEKELKCVHIAGTNGKGSTSLVISEVLAQAGYRVGRFTSPHIHSYSERFVINGREISMFELKEYLDQMKLHIQVMLEKDMENPTEFEVLTALAFQYFKDHSVDLAVIEVGMGGIYDSTNVINPLVSVITGIDYDHTAVLGGTLEEIAANKAGIIKDTTPVVVGKMRPEALKVIQQTALGKGAPLYEGHATVPVCRNGEPDLQGQHVDIVFPGKQFSRIRYGLSGDYQVDNLQTALTALWVLEQQGYSVSDEDLTAALAALKYPGRLEVVSAEPLVIMDVGHNPQGAAAVAMALQSLLPGRQKVLVCGLLDDKNAEQVIFHLGQDTTHCVICRPEGHRSQNWKRLLAIWNGMFPQKNAWLEEDIARAVDYGLHLLKEDQYLLVSGSFYLIDRARKLFTSA